MPDKQMPNVRYEHAEVSDRFRFWVTDAADAVILHEALMSYRNRECRLPADFLRAEAADRLLGALDRDIAQLSERREQESNVPALIEEARK
jgi:hypothetical protein